MEDKNAQSATSQQSSTDPRLARQRVIQPDASFVAEVQAAQQPAPDQVQPVPQGTSKASPQTPTPPSNQPQRPVVPTSSIYPDASKGIGIPSNKPSFDFPSDEPAPTAVKQTAKILAVRAVAAIMILINAVNAYNWLLERRAGYTSWPTIIGAGLGLMLAIGIFTLSEFARAVYVFLSVVMLVLAVIGLIVFYSSIHNNPGAITPLTKPELEHSLQAAQNNTSFTPKQRQEIEQSLQKQINALSGSPVEVKVKQYLSFGLLVVVSVGPLVFFTRPSIKEVFG